MNNVSAAMARVKQIQGRVSAHAPSGNFQAALDQANTEVGGGATIQSLPRTPTTQFTFGNLIGITTSHPVGPTVIRRPPVEGVFTRAQLDEYLRETGIAGRNGRLVSAELVPVSGGWSGRQSGLVEPAAVAWEQMRTEAAEEGIELHYVDAYRSWESQHAAHQRFLRGEKAEHVLAAGTSQHGVGLAVDVTDGSIIRSHSEEWNWLQTNGPGFGWWPISNESWHWEFRGT